MEAPRDHILSACELCTRIDRAHLDRGTGTDVTQVTQFCASKHYCIMNFYTLPVIVRVT